MNSVKSVINARTRAIASAIRASGAEKGNSEMSNFSDAQAIDSLRGISVIGNVLVNATGELNTTTITDLNGTAVSGNRFRLRGQGGGKWACAAMIANNGVGNVDPEWGIKDFVFNGNPINKLSFQESLADRSNSAAFMSLEAIRSGISPFAWQHLPPFGPNDFLDIVAYNSDGVAVVLAQAQFWIFEVPESYKADDGHCIPTGRVG